MVITFLPYPSFEQSISSLDNKRLCKQKLECKQMINVINKYKTEGIVTSYTRHPGVIMWMGYENALKYYHNLCIYEWVSRGKNNTMEYLEHGEVEYPWYFGWEPFHLSHQASLLRKDPEFYSAIFNPIDFYMLRGYIWPSHHHPDVIEYINNNIHEVDTYCTNGKPLFAKV